MPKRAFFARMRFSRQILLLQIGVVVLVLGLGVALVGWLLRSTLDDREVRRGGSGRGPPGSGETAE
jgi:two-component system CitB family sensor kinase